MENQRQKKTGGRKKGSLNLVTTTVKTRISLLIDRNWQLIQDDLDSLTPKDRLTALTNLLPYVLPKLASSTNDISIKSKLEDLSTEQLEKVIDQILIEEAQ